MCFLSLNEMDSIIAQAAPDSAIGPQEPFYSAWTFSALKAKLRMQALDAEAHLGLGDIATAKALYRRLAGEPWHRKLYSTNPITKQELFCTC